MAKRQLAVTGHQAVATRVRDGHPPPYLESSRSLEAWLLMAPFSKKGIKAPKFKQFVRGHAVTTIFYSTKNGPLFTIYFLNWFRLHRSEGEKGKAARETSALHGQNRALGINTVSSAVVPAGV